MMLVWIVWSNEPIAVFSSEERAKNYIARYGNVNAWSCGAAQINSEELEKEKLGACQNKLRLRSCLAH